MGAYADPWLENRLSMSGRLEIDTGPKGQMVGVQGGANLEEVVRALNQLGQSPKDLMAILQAMKAAGALNAELEVI
jgi:flagellar P-ring protein precursor FlgI